ncbi:unnamed protein product [Caenorhabditis bovis]|uniref:BTB domain-containing protein n=1 Tax=Caenorhabditis bovis TaxID=2654633 RepID=A0A8S1E8Y4_9PELO|nr:unnamed protein product [Caenorhabditis bovis]
MTSFLKKLVEHRSKSPTKRSAPNGTNSRSNFPHPYLEPYANVPLAPVCYLPLPPSPLPRPSNSPMPTRSGSGQSNRNGSNHSNDSFGVHSWNTEPRDSDDIFYQIKDDISGPGPLIRARSHSPRKPKRDDSGQKIKSKSKSPQKKHRTVINQLDYLNSQCHLEGCSTNIVVHSTRFLLCRHQLCHASDYFKDLLQEHRSNEDVYVSVSSMSDPSPSTQFRWFVESCIPCPALKDISDETLETCMRLSKRFSARGLELRCSKFIIENSCTRQPIVALCWLNCALKHQFDAQTQASLLPSVARLSLNALERHRHMLTERIYSELLTAKLRGTYDKAVQVFRTIHRMDHFTVDLDKCPKCQRMRDGMRVKVHCDPCRKQIGCDRCHQNGCDIEAKAGEDLQAFFQCPHQLVPLNDSTDECHCQIPILAQHLGAQTFFRAEDNRYMNTTDTPRRTLNRRAKHAKDQEYVNGK